MKQLFLSAIFVLGFSIYGKSQQNNIPLDTIKVILENDKLKVTEYSSTPGSEAETHIAINNGNKPAKVYLVEVK